MKLIWLFILMYSAVLTNTEDSDEGGYEVLEYTTVLNNPSSLANEFTSFTTEKGQPEDDECSSKLSKQSYCKSVEHDIKSVAEKIDHLTEKMNQLIDLTAGGEARCPENAADGVYRLKPHHSSIAPFPVYCERGWIVIHRRLDGSLDFNRNWTSYREGFGDVQGEHWLGLEKMHQITRAGSYNLLVVLKSFEGVVKTAMYEGFEISSEIKLYQLGLKRFSGGDAGNSLMSHNTMKFSTPDRADSSNILCAPSLKCGWWFTHCYFANLNGRYNEGSTCSMSWYNFHNKYDCLKEARMMIRVATPEKYNRI